jgi:group I intron endonuclease
MALQPYLAVHFNIMIAYLVTNTVNKKQYVGITTRTLGRRWYEHKHVANSCGKVLHAAIKKYGENAFIVKQIASGLGDISNLKLLETDLIKQYGTYKYGYNVTKGGDGVFGLKQSEEQRKRNGDLKRGTKASEETKAKMRIAHSGEKNSFYGKTHSDYSKAKISATKQGCAGHWLGKTRSEETKRKISESLKIRNQQARI